MASKLKKSVAELLNRAQLAINNTLNDDQILQRVAAYGYDEAKMLEGRGPHEQAQAAYNAKEAAAGAQGDATEQTVTARKAAYDAYQALAKIAKAIFKKDEPSLTALELRGEMPRATAAFLARAYRLFDNALNVPETASLLEEYRYDLTRLEQERARIVAFDDANQAQEAAKGDAQQATVDQNDAVVLLRDWYGQYIKIARVALRDRRQLLEKMNIPARTSLTKAQRAARRERTQRTRRRTLV